MMFRILVEVSLEVSQMGMVPKARRHSNIYHGVDCFNGPRLPAVEQSNHGGIFYV